MLTVDIAAWPGFLAEVTGTAPPGSNDALRIEHQADGGVCLHATDGSALTYTTVEWTAFIEGAIVGQFTLQPAA